jgi:hypothetical protein
METEVNKFKKALFTVLFLVGAFCLSAQDKIIFMSGEEINARVIEITPDFVKYSTAADGPVRIVSKPDVFSITYQNGTKDVLAGVSKPAEPLAETSSSKPGANTAAADTDFVEHGNKKFGGPRLGLTYISPGTLADRLAEKGKNPMVTQFGWQFETRIFSIDNGPSGLVEFVPLIAGLEQGLFLPSANFLIGLRSGGKQPVEFAMGPNVSVSGFGMVFVLGTNFYSSKVNFPVNIALVPSVGSKEDKYDPVTQTTSSRIVQTGWRLTLTVGFNSRKK